MSDSDKGLGDLVDFRAIGIRFRQLGYGTSDVARALNEAPSTVHDWLMGRKEPRYTAGVLLIALYSRVESGSVNNLSAKAQQARIAA